MSQEHFIEYLYNRYKNQIVNVADLKEHLTNFFSIDYVRVIYAVLSGYRNTKLVDMSYIYQLLRNTKKGLPKDIMLNYVNYKNYVEITKLHEFHVSCLLLATIN